MGIWIKHDDRILFAHELRLDDLGILLAEGTDGMIYGSSIKPERCKEIYNEIWETIKRGGTYYEIKE